MSLHEVKRQIENNGFAIVNRVCKNNNGVMAVYMPDMKDQHPCVKEVTNTHVIGEWLPFYSSMAEVNAATEDWPGQRESDVSYYGLNPRRLLPTKFRVKHDSEKFSFGGGSSSGTRNYFFKNVRAIVTQP